jgi:hypothetical protein
MDGWVDGGKSPFKDCLQQSIRHFYVPFLNTVGIRTPGKSGFEWPT